MLHKRPCRYSSTILLWRQVKGKGYWGEWEGIEKIMGLSPAAAAWVNRPLNYARVQVRHASPWLS